MDLESYLNEEENFIMAITLLAKAIDTRLIDISPQYIKNSSLENTIKEIKGLNSAILMSVYCKRLLRKEAYLLIDSAFEDDFTLSSVLYEDLL